MSLYTDGLMQDCSISNTNALEIGSSNTKSSISPRVYADINKSLYLFINI